MAAFAAISGDYNPLHCDDGFARSEGLSGTRCVWSSAGRKNIPAHRHGIAGSDAVWAGLDIQFVSPLFVDNGRDRSDLVARLGSGSRARIDVTHEAGGKLIARGRLRLWCIAMLNPCSHGGSGGIGSAFVRPSRQGRLSPHLGFAKSRALPKRSRPCAAARCLALDMSSPKSNDAAIADLKQHIRTRRRRARRLDPRRTSGRLRASPKTT